MTARFGSCKRRTATTLPEFLTDPTRACADRDPDLFYSAADTDQNSARNICKPCPFRDECLTWALRLGERNGVWGGILMSSSHERNRARRGLARIDEHVHNLWTTGHDDGQIAAVLGVAKCTVRASRKRQNLPALYGPGGKALEEVAA